MAPAPSRLAFIARRLVGLVAVLVIVSFLVFSLLYIAPGSPEQLVLGNSKTIDPATLHAVRQEYHLEGPFLVRYLDWAGSALRLDFGRSIRTSEPVRQGIAQRLALTSELAGIAFMMTLAFGIPLGVLAAVRRAQLVDRGVVFFSIVGLSAPAFATGILLLYIFAVRIGWFPAFGQGEGLTSRLQHLVLPAVALALTATGLVVKITRAAFVDELQKDYVVFARARGIRPARVLFGFVLRNAATPIITAAGLILAYMLAGGSDASNEDPFATKPAEGHTWIDTDPHLMVLNIGDHFAGYPTTHDNTKAPYVMYPKTPYAHLMIPIK